MEASAASSTSDTEDEEEEWQPPMKGALVACIEARDEVLLDYQLFVEFFFLRSLSSR